MTSPGFAAVDVISRKRDRGELSDEQIDWVVGAYTRGEVADEQMSALAMAILLNGMTRREISRWTAAMIASGDRLDFSGLERATADKHSTGGVGDKKNLPPPPPLAPHRGARPPPARPRPRDTGGTPGKPQANPGRGAAPRHHAP